MKTRAEREAEFRKDLAELCEKHNAEIDVTDGRRGPIAVVTMCTEWDEDGGKIAEYTEFQL